ncbi:MAG: peptidylprolyl isomerase [Caulobacteraceae bacterium]|nr:peptidylprolyl isomerase [Caulobacteraceae bacterium]
MFKSILAILAAVFLASAAHAAVPRVAIDTEKGRIVVEVYPDKAPISAGNFLMYADKGLYKGATIYRTVRADNDHNPAKITVIQGGLNLEEGQPDPAPPIAHETTEATGIKHTDGVISMARGDPGTAGAEFFICIGDNPALDFGGQRNPDGQGFAAFGKVVEGMDVVKAINAAKADLATPDDYVRGQLLSPPVKILSVKRLP